MMLAAEVHLGTKNCDFQMERYVFKRRNDGILAVLFLCTYPSVLDVLIVILLGNK
jgi:ribosomal protein S2